MVRLSDSEEQFTTSRFIGIHVFNFFLVGKIEGGLRGEIGRSTNRPYIESGNRKSWKFTTENTCTYIVKALATKEGCL